MKVLLLNPPARGLVVRDYYCSKRTKSNYLFQPIDLLMQSGLLALRHELIVLDAVARRMSAAECLAEIGRLRPEAVLGLWGAATDREDEEFYREFSRRFQAQLFLSGEVFLEEPEAWLSDRPFVKGLLLRFISSGLCDYLDTGSPGPDLLVREADGLRGGLDPSPGGDFSLGRPRHELFGHRGYRFSFARGKKFATVLTDFGCPFKCGFCVMAGLGYRRRPLDEVIAEWKWLKERGIDELFVSDQCFGAARERSLELCRRAAAEVPRLGWTTFTRSDLLDVHLIRAMKTAGCHTVIMGVETGAPQLLSAYHKGLSLEEIKAGFARCRENGLRTVATFILGLPEDTADTIRRTIRLAREINPDFVSYNVAVPRATTMLRAAARAEGLADPRINPDQAGEVVAMRTRALSREEVAAWKKRAVRDFYLRPAYLLRRISSVRSFRELAAETREGIALIAKNL